MPRRPNYGQERAERQRRKAARRDERLAAKAERRDKGPSSDVAVAGPETSAPQQAETLGVPIPDDRGAMMRLAQALRFVCGAEHPTTLAVQRAANSGVGDDIDLARTLFLQLTPGNQRAALAIAAAAPSSLR